jgi:hypothetical protein
MSAVVFLVLLIAFAAAVTIWVVYFLLDKAPPYPQIAGMSSGDVKASIENYHDLAREWRDGILDVFETVVTKAILPLVLLLFGYLFGRGAGD